MVLKTRAEARANLEAAAGTIGSRYEAGVKKASWFNAASSEEAEKNYAQAIQNAVSKKSRQAGVQRVGGDAGWRDAAVNKGAPVIGDRVRGALAKWEARWGPMYDKVAAKVNALPKRTLDFRTNINNRAVPVVEEWKRSAGKL